MKKFIVLLLAALMIVGLFVSCKEGPKVAPPETVDNVVESTISTFYIFGDYVYELAYEKINPDVVKAEMDPGIKEIFKEEFEETVEVKSTVTSTSINAEIKDEDNINTVKVDISGLKYDETTERISGSFAVYATGKEEGNPITYDVNGTFDISFSEKGVSTIEYTSVKYCGTEYAVAAFNDEMKEFLENWPVFMAVGTWETTTPGSITISVTVTEYDFSLVMISGETEVGAATGTWVPFNPYTGELTVDTSEGYALDLFEPGDILDFSADEENLHVDNYVFDRT